MSISIGNRANVVLPLGISSIIAYDLAALDSVGLSEGNNFKKISQAVSEELQTLWHDNFVYKISVEVELSEWNYQWQWVGLQRLPNVSVTPAKGSVVVTEFLVGATYT